MPSPNYLQSQGEIQPHGSPYCSDPNCQSCRDLREIQEAIRLGRPDDRSPQGNLVELTLIGAF